MLKKQEQESEKLEEKSIFDEETDMDLEESSKQSSEKTSDKKKKSKKLDEEEIVNTDSDDSVETKAKTGDDEEIKPEVQVSVQESVIEKIKVFLSKIAEMQKEASEDISPSDSKKSDETKKEEKPKFILEYYDLPYRYNETIVKVLAQTPQKLFVYWDISDNDRKKYEDTFGQNFYNNTYPVLLLYNEDKQYVREIAVNDFANSWYIDISDPKTKYIIQLGRKFKDGYLDIDYDKVRRNNIILRNDYLPYAESNMMEAPNDHVLIEELPDFIRFRNVKTNEEYLIDVKGMRQLFGKNYDVSAFYKDQFDGEFENGKFDMKNPSSRGGLNSSTFK